MLCHTLACDGSAGEEALAPEKTPSLPHVEGPTEETTETSTSTDHPSPVPHPPDTTPPPEPTSPCSFEALADNGNTRRLCYRLAWDYGDGVSLGEEGWQITNDQGYLITLHRAGLTTYLMMLLSCEYMQEQFGWYLPFKKLWRSITGIRTAWAGHPSQDPTSTPTVAAAMLGPEITPLPTHLPPEEFCGIYYLVARAPNIASVLETAPFMVDRSISLQGTYRAPGSSEDNAFTIESIKSFSEIQSFTPYDLTVGPETPEKVLNITVRRHLHSLFDGIDFATATALEMETQVLLNVVQHITYEFHSH